MELLQKIDAAYKDAFVSKAGLKLSTLRMLRAALKNKSIELRTELKETEIVAVLRSEVKKRKEAIEAYEAGGRPELAEKEKEEMAFLQEFLPIQLAEEQIEAVAKQVLAGLSEEDKHNFGKAMGAVMSALKGQAEGQLVGQIVKKLLS